MNVDEDGLDVDDPSLRKVTFGAPSVREVDSPRFRVSVADFGPGLEIPSHFHARACISVVVEGRFLQRFSRRSFDCRPGAVLTKPPEERHSDEWLAPRSRHLIIEPNPKALDDLGPVEKWVREVCFLRDAGALTLARRMIREVSDPDDMTPLAAEALVLELMTRLSRLPESTPGSAPAWALRVRDLLHLRHDDRLTLDDLAEEAGVHPAHLSRVFSDYFGITLGAYRRQIRLEAAKAALATTDAPLSRVALDAGFSDQSHLTRQLKRATGMTPAEYRRAHRF